MLLPLAFISDLSTIYSPLKVLSTLSRHLPQNGLVLTPTLDPLKYSHHPAPYLASPTRLQGLRAGPVPPLTRTPGPDSGALPLKLSLLPPSSGLSSRDMEAEWGRESFCNLCLGPSFSWHSRGEEKVQTVSSRGRWRIKRQNRKIRLLGAMNARELLKVFQAAER